MILYMILEIFQKFNVTGYCALDEVVKIISFGAAPSLLLYSYIPVVLVSLALSFIILKQNKNNRIARSFFIFSALYSLWVVNIILQWIFVPNKLLFTVWQLTALLEVSFYLSAIYLFIYFLTNKELNRRIKWLFYSFVGLIIFLTPSIYNITSYDYQNCTGNIGPIWYIIYGFEVLVSIIILVYGFIFSKKEIDTTRRRNIRIFSVALSLFTAIFAISNILGEVLQIYTVNLYGPIGMLVFMGIVTYLIVKYQAFNVKLIYVEVLVLGLVILIGSQFFFIKVTTNFILNGITFVGIIIFGKFLIRSVKREIDQRERLEHLRLKLEESNIKLENANEKLNGLDKLKTEFLSLASHQLRSPLTAIKGYSSMLLEGDYGKIDATTREAIDRIFESSQNLTKVVEDLLNVSKIEQGGMKYEVAPFNLCQMARDETKQFSIIAEKKGLKLDFEGVNDDLCMVNADKEKIRQVLINFIDNSIKYTKNGNIKVSVNNIDGKVIFSIKDTGMGISPEIKESLFEKFARGEGARMNTTGSGLGLYLAKEIAVASKGRVWAESEGMGKGSTFYMELNAIDK